MNLKRIVALVAIAGGLAALVASAATAGRRRVVATPTDGAQIHAVEQSGAALAVEIERLHERLRPTTPPEQPARNLFRFRTAPATGPGAPRPVVPPGDIPAAAPIPPQTTMKLIGIAEDAGAGGPIRTAIIAGPTDLFLVKEGDALTPHYRVVRISSTAVELTDLDNSTTIHLALK